MNAESRENRERQSPLPPTTLHLFRLKETDRVFLTKGIKDLEQFVHRANNTFESWRKLKSITDDKKARLSDRERETEEEVLVLRSSAGCGAVFLKMSEEFPTLSDGELMDLFKVCLRSHETIRTFFGKDIFKETKQAIDIKMLSRTNNTKDLKIKHRALVEKLFGEPPSWFHGNKASWVELVRSHSFFPQYLAPDNLPKNLDSSLAKKFRITFGIITPGDYPDWLTDNEHLPTREQVRQELTEDMEEMQRIEQEKGKYSQQMHFLNENLVRKVEKAQKWLVAQIDKLFAQENPSDFANWILHLYLKSCMPTSGTEEKPVSSKSTLEGMIQLATQTEDLASTPAVIALAIERAMKESGIAQSSQNPIDATLIDFFDLLFNAMPTGNKEDPAAVEFNELRSKNKKVFQGLNYDIKPFLEILTSDEILYLQELLKEYKGYPIEAFIWDVADSAASHFGKQESDEKEKIKVKTANSLRKPTASFLRNNLDWIYNQLKTSLYGPAVIFENLSPTVPIPPVETNGHLDDSDPQEEIQSSIKEIQEGNLSGWKILYTTNRSPDPKYLVEIGGETIDEREEELEKFFIKEGIGHSIKTTSIVHVLDDLPVFPEELRRRRSKKIINGVEFGKTRRGGGRMFDIVDYKNKTIIFFHFQKQAQTYGF